LVSSFGFNVGEGKALHMISRWITSTISAVALLSATLSSALPASADQAPDKNGPGVARVSVVQGTAVVQRGDSNKQENAVVNAPLLPGDYISTGSSARGELQFDGSTAIRLGGNVQARITNDDPNNRQLQLADGTVEVGLVRDTELVAIDTPSVTVRARRAGDYRISIDRDGSSWVTTRRGEAEVVTPQRTYTLDSGRTLVARGSASNPSVTYASEIGYDSFDDFNAKRDQTMVAALNASPNLNPDIAGYDNLSAYGNWQDVAGYGQVWVPDQTSNWAPYSDGSWTWEDGYGWTWVASEPWGWAPYHYGRWFYANGYGWAWYPPAYTAYPAWSPALVGFFGFGVGVSVGFGYPYLGWYPLAPYAAFYPWYPGWSWYGGGWGWGGGGCCWSGWGGTRVVNVTHVTNIYRYFPHGGVHGTVVGNLTHGSVAGHTFVVNQRNISGHVGEIRGAVPVTPSRDSLGFGGRPVRDPVAVSKTFNSPRFASETNRALANRMPFDQQQRAVSRAIESNAHAGAPVSHENAPVAHENAPVAHENAPVAHADNTDRRAPSSSWQRFDQTRGTENRGTEGRGGEPGSAGRDNTAFDRTPQTSHEDRAPSTSWNRFSEDRGSAAAPAEGRGTYSSYSHNSYSSSYSHNSYSNSYSHNPYSSSYSHASYPSYARSSYGSYPSYARGSYGSPSYSHGSYGSPSYSHGSYGSPSYSHGSYGSAPAYSRGSAPSYSHAGGNSAPHPSGGGAGGASHGGGGRPPQL
jgi:hypothetical protein